MLLRFHIIYCEPPSRQYDCVAASQVLFLTSYIIEPLSASQHHHQPCCSLHYVTDIYMGEVGK